MITKQTFLDALSRFLYNCDNKFAPISSLVVESGDGESSVQQKGSGAYAEGVAAFAEGSISWAEGDGSHAEGYDTHAEGNYSHAEGSGTHTLSDNAHAEGIDSIASGDASHTEGEGTTTNNIAEHAEGSYNISIQNVTKHTVGIGTANNVRKNAQVITVDGSIYILGIGGTSGTEATAADLSQRTDLATFVNSLVPGIGPQKRTTTLTIPSATINLELYNSRFGISSNAEGKTITDDVIYNLYSEAMLSIGQAPKSQSDKNGIFNDLVDYFSSATLDIIADSGPNVTHNLYKCTQYIDNSVQDNTKTVEFTYTQGEYSAQVNEGYTLLIEKNEQSHISIEIVHL